MNRQILEADLDIVLGDFEDLRAASAYSNTLVTLVIRIVVEASRTMHNLCSSSSPAAENVCESGEHHGEFDRGVHNGRMRGSARGCPAH